MILDAIACAICEAGIAIGAYYVVQAYIQCSLLDRDNACCFVYQLVVAKLIAYQLRSCYSHVRLIGSDIRSVAVALVGCILSVSFVAYACAILQAYLIAVDDAVILQAHIAICFQTFLAAVGRAGVDVVQVNLLRIYFRIACGYFDIVVLGEVCYILGNDTVFPYGPLVIAFVVCLAIVVYKTAIGNCTFFDAYSSFITVDKCVVILDAIACAICEAGIAIGTYYVIQAYLQGCLFNHGSTIINNQLIVLLKLIVRCNYIGVPLISITSIIGYLACACACQRAISGNRYLNIAGSIIIAVDITSQSVNAICCTINQRCITISTLNIVQRNVHFCLLNGNTACSVINQLIVAQLTCIAGKRCIINLQAVIICINICSIALALINRIFAAILHINNSTVSQLDIITINNSACQILNAYHTIDMVVNSIAAAVGQISINIIQVNRAR